MSLNAVAAQILESSAQGFAREAAVRLQEQLARDNVQLAEPDAAWQQHLYQRIMELAAAIRVGQPALFQDKIQWLRHAWVSRGVSPRVTVAILDSLRATINEDFPKESAISVMQILDETLESLKAPFVPVQSTIAPDSVPGKLALRYIAACMDAATDAAQSMILDAIDAGMSPQSVVTDVLMPAQREIGDLWHSDDASISQEHLLTNTTAELLAIIGQKFAGKTNNDKKALVASVAGNAHDVGIRAAAVLLRLAGWRTIFLGTDLPPKEISAAADFFDADIVILSATIATHVDAIADTVRSLRQTKTNPAIIVGGAMFESAPQLRESLGADALCAHIADTVETAERQLIGR